MFEKALQNLKLALYSDSVKKNVIWLSILGSLALHFSGYWGIGHLKPFPTPLVENKKRVVELEIMESPVTQDTPAPIRLPETPKELLDDSLEALKNKAREFSDRTQRVKKEMRAAIASATKNRNNSQLAKTILQSKIQPLNSRSTGDSLGDLAGQTLPSKTQTDLSLEMGVSSLESRLQNNIQVGKLTALNTDRHLFASFYNRIAEAIVPTWEDLVREEGRLLQNRHLIIPKEGWTTRLDVILSPKGEVHRVVVLKPSGIGGFDSAARVAFQRASYFPNPPKEMINPEGLIVLKYLFTVF